MTHVEFVNADGHVYAEHLFCRAWKKRNEMRERGFNSFFWFERIDRFILYWIACTPTVPKPTRAERGCNL